MAADHPPTNDYVSENGDEFSSSAEPEPLGAGIDFTDPNSSLAPYYMTVADVIGVLLICLIVTFFGSLRLWHSDIWGHVRFGEWILEHRELPEQEPFSPYSDKSQKPVHTQWLSQTLYGSIVGFSEWVGGNKHSPERTLARTGEMLRFFHLALVATQFTFLWLAFRRFGGSSVWANAAIIAAWLLMITFLSVQRPQGFGLVGLSMLLYALSRPELSRRSLICLPILFALWANLHGSFVVGLGFFFLFAAARIGTRLSRENWKQVFQNTDVRRLFVTFVLCVATAGLCNPHGPMVYYHVATFSNRPNIDILSEWQPLRFSDQAADRYRLLALIAGVLWIASGFAGTAWLLVCLPFALWPFVQQRGMVWWALLFPWLVSYLGPQAVGRLGIPSLPPSVPSFRKTLLAASIVVLAIIWQRPVQAVLNGKKLRPAAEVFSFGTPWRLGLELQGVSKDDEFRKRWAAAIADYPDGHFRGAVYSTEVLGDYLLRVVPPGSDVLLYSHLHFFSSAHARACAAVAVVEGDWRKFLEDRGVNLIVIQPDRVPDLANELRKDPDWTVVEDEAETPGRGEGDRLFIALRKHPL